LAVAVTGCSLFSPNITKDKLLANIKKAVDPGNKLANVKTKILTGEVNRGVKLKPARIIIKIKYPNKWQMLAAVPKKGIFIRSYDGKNGWEFSTQNGYKQLTGSALDELKLQTALAANHSDLKSILKSIEFAGEAKVVGESCYKLIAIPKDIYRSEPLTLYVNKKTFLPFMRQEQYDGSQGKFEMSTILSDYQRHDGVMIPMTRIIEFNHNLIDITIKSIEFNSYIDDADFIQPEQF
jgi:outer membrane lipoprotein-sorting protein